jgi:hypothetical protein
MAFHILVRPAAVGISLLLLTAAAADEKKTPAALTPKEVREGWVLLFDGESTFGFETGGAVKADGGRLLVGSPENGGSVSTKAEFTRGLVRLRYKITGPKWALLTWREGKQDLSSANDFSTVEWEPGEKVTSPIRIDAPPGTTVTVGLFAVKPRELTPLFNGKDLAGWKPYKGDPKREKSVFAVTPAGELSVKNGPGDLQAEGQWADFVLQLECKTNGKALNSGVFFRCLPGQYQQGYEAQIQNAFLKGDRTKPADYGTGAVYRRVAARKVVADDNEWFTMAVLAKGPHVSTWVNGYPVVSWTDDRKPAENPRQGLYTKKGPISIQGHDPTTDLLFRNIRLAELKRD